MWGRYLWGTNLPQLDTLRLTRASVKIVAGGRVAGVEQSEPPVGAVWELVTLDLSLLKFEVNHYPITQQLTAQSVQL